MTTTLTCEHCDSEIDVTKDPRCVVYEPSGRTDVICQACRERARAAHERAFTDQLREAYRIKRGWQA